MHEIHGLRVVDVLTNYGIGLNLTYEVRDGIVTHCGERFEQIVAPDRGRDLSSLETIAERMYYPSTLEGCVVRMVDRIAYLGRDLEDGIKAGLVDKTDVPADVVRELGTDNGKIIGAFVNDIIAESIDQDRIALSGRVFELMTVLKEFNYERIYRHPEVMAESRKSDHIIRLLFDEHMRAFRESDRGRNEGYVQHRIREAPSTQVFFHFIKNTSYTDETPDWRVVADYVAGMTDVFAQRSYGQLFLPAPLV